MKISELRIPSTDGVHDLYAKLYEPDETPKALVQIVHGMVEHIERYDSVMRILCENGFAVCAHDHLGHGKTVSDETELGYFAEKDGWSVLIDDVHTVKTAVRKRLSDCGAKTVLFGHSMGSFVARLTYARYDDYDALVACGTGGNNPGSGFGVVMTKIIKAFRGSHARSKLLYALVFGTYNKKFGATGGFEWLTRDTDMVAIHDADKLCTFDFSVSALLDLITLNRRANSKKWFEAVDTEKPVLLIAGSDDPVGNYGKGVKEVYDRLVATGHKNVSLKLYDGARHEILNETNRDEVNKDLTDFIRSVTEE